ncbi:MAG: ATP-binding protein, partial [Bdellovibrionia bacterium]
MAESKPLRFRVTPHIVEDLGLNLYTDLPKVLVEFVANAYDADSADAYIQMDFEKIKEARQKVFAEWSKKKNETDGKDDELKPLSNWTLPENISITIFDRGHGMSRDDLSNKFLIAGRRRREEEKKYRTDGGRLLMGRKGLGKLAGFGIAHLVTIISKPKGGKLTKIVLDYDQIRYHKSTSDGVPVSELPITKDDDIGVCGTKVILSRLVYEPMKSRDQTIAHQIADHFAFIKQSDFSVYMNDEQIKPLKRTFKFAYPNPDLPSERLIKGHIDAEEGGKLEFEYRFRFTGSKEHLTGSQQGVRVYAHKRLASAPSLLDLHTGIHGFRWTH